MDKTKKLKTGRNKNQVGYKEDPIRMAFEFSM